MKSQKYILYAVLALLFLTPGLISLMFFMLSDNVTEKDRDIALEIIDKNGNEYLFENTEDMSILFHDIVNDNKKTVSFCYASPQIKEIMTNEGKILELYVYYKALEENYYYSFKHFTCDYFIVIRNFGCFAL